MEMKKRVKQAIAIGLSLAMVCTVPVCAAGEEYSLTGEKSIGSVQTGSVSAGFKRSDDYYVFGDSAFYSAYKTDEGQGDTTPKVTFEVYRANKDGSGQKKLCEKTVEGMEGGIELVTQNYILLTYGVMTTENAMLIDRQTYKVSAMDPFERFGFSEKEYAGGKLNTQHVGNYYPLQRSHSDVSPQKAIVFNGENAEKKPLAAKCWDARVAGNVIYYISEKKDGFYLGRANGNGDKNKVLGKLNTPDNCVFAKIVSVKGDTLTYKAMSSKGNKSYKYSLK